MIDPTWGTPKLCVPLDEMTVLYIPVILDKFVEQFSRASCSSIKRAGCNPCFACLRPHRYNVIVDRSAYIDRHHVYLLRKSESIIG